MAYKWPDLKPTEIQAYSVDWSRFLEMNGDTISSVVWLVNDYTMVSYGTYNNINGELQMLQPTNTNTVATTRFTAGISGTRYMITCRVITSSGLVHERDIYLRVQE